MWLVMVGGCLEKRGLSGVVYGLGHGAEMIADWGVLSSLIRKDEGSICVKRNTQILL